MLMQPSCLIVHAGMGLMPSLVVLSTGDSELPSPDSSDDEGDGCNKHSMLIVGFRVQCEGNGKKIWFLVQNSWKSMPLLEVSAAFLSKHVDLNEGGYALIRKPLDTFPVGMQPARGLVLESSFMDGGDNEETAAVDWQD
jgi:hypothetical protein